MRTSESVRMVNGIVSMADRLSSLCLYKAWQAPEESVEEDEASG